MSDIKCLACGTTFSAVGQIEANEWHEEHAKGCAARERQAERGAVNEGIGGQVSLNGLLRGAMMSAMPMKNGRRMPRVWYDETAHFRCEL